MQDPEPWSPDPEFSICAPGFRSWDPGFEILDPGLGSLPQVRLLLAARPTARRVLDLRSSFLDPASGMLDDGT